MNYEPNFLRKSLSQFFVLLVLSFGFEAFASESDMCKADAIKCFEGYREAVSSKSPNLARFFSKEVNEEWLNSLNKNRSSEDQLAVLGAVRSKASFARRICTVNHYESVDSHNGQRLLKVFYKNSDGKGPFLYDISFVKQMGRWYISSTLSDTTVDGKKYSENKLQEFCKE